MSDEANLSLDQSNQDNPFNETVQAHMLQIMGQQQYIPTQSQVDKILAIQEKGMDYTHQERCQNSPHQKIIFISFIMAIITLLVIFTLTLFFAKEYLSQVVSGVFGILAGSGIGYGYGKHSKD